MIFFLKRFRYSEFTIKRVSEVNGICKLRISVSRYTVSISTSLQIDDPKPDLYLSHAKTLHRNPDKHWAAARPMLPYPIRLTAFSLISSPRLPSLSHALFRTC